MNARSYPQHEMSSEAFNRLNECLACIFEHGPLRRQELRARLRPMSRNDMDWAITRALKAGSIKIVEPGVLGITPKGRTLVLTYGQKEPL